MDEVGRVAAGGERRRRAKQRAHADYEEEGRAAERERELVGDQEVGDEQHAERGQGAEQRVSAGRADSRGEPGEPAVQQRSPHAQHVDRPHRGGDQEADGEPLEENPLEHVGRADRADPARRELPSTRGVGTLLASVPGPGKRRARAAG
jgi:hypothetical protein